MQNLGKKITELRNKNNMSQGDLADKMNISRQSISKWETGTSVPELDKLIMLSEIFHISIDELVKENGTCIETENESESKPKPSKTIPAENVLLVFALISCAIGILLFNISGLLGINIILSCIVSIKMKKSVLFVCLWITILILAVYSPDLYFLITGKSSILIVGVWLCALLVSLYTIWIFYKTHQEKGV